MGKYVIWLIFAIVGLPLAFFVSEGSRRMVLRKCRQYNREVPERVAKSIIWLTRGLWYIVIVVTGILSMQTLGTIGMICVEVFALVGIIIGVTDYYVRLIPNECLLAILPFIILYMIFYDFMANVPFWQIPVTFISIIIIMVGPNLITKKTVVAAGDVKFWLLVALALPGSRMFTALLFFSIAFLAYGSIGLFTRSIDLRSYFPMGGFIALGLVAGAIWTISEFAEFIL